MARTPQDVSPKELEILKVLWEQGPATIRQITDVLYPGGGTSKYATVQTLLERLEEDGHVRRDRSGAAHVFTAAVNRDELIGQRLEAVAQQLCDGSLTPLLTHLVRNRKLTARQRRELRSLIDELEEKRSSKNDNR
jgi:BlaI family penicillinase repressor